MIDRCWLPDVIISGGQTGVDRGALDAARQLGIAHGGWCPDGRRAEDGVIPERYQLRETPSRRYAQRTAWNVRDADATLVLHEGDLDGGTALTVRIARALQRPCVIVDVNDRSAVATVRLEMAQREVKRLNVAGPRESRHPGVGDKARAFLLALFDASCASDTSVPTLSSRV